MYELETWGASPDDNGIGIHLWTTQLGGDELNEWLDKVVAMKMKNVTTLQTDLGFMQAAAVRGLQVYCRPFYRANREWTDDGSCVENMLAAGLKARIQIYNEPDLLSTEWGDETPIDSDWAMQTWANRWLAAATYIFNRGGWPGIQTLDLSWYRYLLERIKAEHPEIIKRTWVCIHNYMSNHKPDYVQDSFSMLAPLWFDKVAIEVLATHLPVVCGEGGWCVGDAADNRYPAITEQTHAEYTVAMFDMFRTGVMPNGDQLPDWWKAVTPWLLSAIRTNGDASFEQNAWYGAWHPDRQLTIDAVKAMPKFVRKYLVTPVPPEPTPTPVPGGEMLKDDYPDLYNAWISAGGDPEESFRFHLLGIGALPVTATNLAEMVKRTQAHVAEVAAIAQLIPKV